MRQYIQTCKPNARFYHFGLSNTHDFPVLIQVPPIFFLVSAISYSQAHTKVRPNTLLSILTNSSNTFQIHAHAALILLHTRSGLWHEGFRALLRYFNFFSFLLPDFPIFIGFLLFIFITTTQKKSTHSLFSTPRY